MTVPITLPGLQTPVLDGVVLSKIWRQFAQDVLLEAHKALVPPKSIVACHLSADDVAAEFDATGLGRRGGPYQWWAICNGSNDTPDLTGLFLRGSVTEAGNEGGSSTSGASSGNTGAGGNFSTSINSASQTVQSGVGVTVAASPHSHTSASHSHSLNAHTHSVDPPRYDVVYLMRLP